MITETTITEENEAAGAETQGFHLLVMSLEVFWSLRLPSSGVVSIGRSKKCDVQIDDAMASREHARIHIGSDSGVPVLTIEDVGSANGTRVRDTVIKQGEPAAILPGEAIAVGSTVLMIMQDRPTTGVRRIWSHAHFESRVDDECVRAAKTRAPFALARIRFTGAAPWTRVTPVLARELTAPHVVASYGPQDYETLFLDVQPSELETLVRKLADAFAAADLTAQAAVAWFPHDGRTSDALLAAANGALKRAAGKDAPQKDVDVGARTTGMQRVRALAVRAASSSINVLILGESGVGKDVLARMIHQMSPRAGKPFLAINCASLPENLLESELFGHEKGAFTNASTAKVGLFESANGGTVFLDEIGEMPLPMQAKLLQAIERREVRPVGSLRTRPIDVRFLSATNVDIETAVANGTFRRDLVYRLNTLTLAIPPLRERREEIPELATTFVRQLAEESGREVPAIDAPAMACLLGYSWPGNIRELRNVIERAVVLCDGNQIRPDHLPLEKMRPAPGEVVEIENPVSLPRPLSRLAMTLPPLDDPEEEAERRRIIDALEESVWSQTRAAVALKMSRRTLVSKLDRYGIPRPQKRLREDSVPPDADLLRKIPVSGSGLAQ